MKNQPRITVGIMDRQAEIFGRLDGNFHGDWFGPVSGQFSARAEAGVTVLFDEAHREICRSPSIRLTGQTGPTFSLFNVNIGNRFHWERKEDQSFQGNLILRLRTDGTIAAINEIPLEDYLTSVISSEMSASAPMEFLKAQAIISRSWLLSALGRKKKIEETSVPKGKIANEEVIRWYDRTEHDLFDVCSDDHCQRYQGITKIISKRGEEAVRETYGRVITYQDEICDARYSKACGGITEDFDTAWNDKRIPYLISTLDGSVSHQLIRTEEKASAWILSKIFLKKSFPTLTARQKPFSGGGSNIPVENWKRSFKKSLVLILGLCKRSYLFAVVLRAESPN
jgi:stage II sporulation protein D